MIIEVASLSGQSVKTTEGKLVGTIQHCVFDQNTGALWGIEVGQKGVLNQSRGVMFEAIVGISPAGAIIDRTEDLQKDTTILRQRRKAGGEILGLAARTESGRSLGYVRDLMIEAESGLIVRFVLSKLLQERIIPRQFVVAVTDKKVIFQDSVEKPTFDQLAARESLAESV